MPKNKDSLMLLSFYNPAWLDSAYTCRKQITLNPGITAIPAGTYVTYTFDHAALVSAGKSLSSGDDIRVSFTKGTTSAESATALRNGSTWNTSNTKIVFQTQEDIAAGSTDNNYFLYYCNPSAAARTSIITDSPVKTFYDSATYTQVNDTNYKTVATASINPASVSQVWLWYVTFSLKTDTAQAGSATNFLARITVNGTSDTTLEQQTNEGGHYKMMVSSGRITGVTGTQTITLDIKSELSTTTTSVKDIRITSILLPADANFQYAAKDSVQTLQTDWADIANPQLTFTPTTTEDYYIIATGQLNDNPTGNGVHLRFVNYDNSNWPATGGPSSFYIAHDRGSYDTFFLIRKINLSASSKTFKFQVRSGSAPYNGTDQANVKGLRIFAFRAGSFANTEGIENTIASNTTSLTAATKSTLAIATPEDYSDYLIFQSQFLYDTEAVPSTTHQNIADFTMDGTVLGSQDHVLNRGETFQVASACVSSIYTNTAHTFTNRYWSNDGVATYSKESVIHALRLKTVSASAGSEETWLPPILK